LVGEKKMGLDIRIPIGLMFSILGVLITLFGLFTNSDKAMYAKSLAINMNVWMGILMLVFGLFMLLLVKLAKKKTK
jgi:prolipoprotein diacylglyceryltransferase